MTTYPNMRYQVLFVQGASSGYCMILFENFGKLSKRPKCTFEQPHLTRSLCTIDHKAMDQPPVPPIVRARFGLEQRCAYRHADLYDEEVPEAPFFGPFIKSDRFDITKSTFLSLTFEVRHLKPIMCNLSICSLSWKSLPLSFEQRRWI